MIGKKINQLATELAPVSTDLTIIGDPISGVSKKITLAQLGAIFSGAVSFYTNLAGFPVTGDINVIYCAKDTQKLYLWSGSAYVEVFPSQALLDTYQLRSEKGNANGYASLDSQGKVPISQLPSSIMEYKGTWNASTNTPTLANGTGDTGDVYICNVAGTVNFGAGAITFAVGDYVIYSGTIWQRSSGAVGTVTSVAASITGNSVTISGSPVTTSGTLAFAFAGTGAQYIKGDGTLATFPTTIDQAKNLITEVYNSTGATLTKGTVVYINGGQGNLPTVTKALASGDSTSAQTYGIVQADITNNNNGFVVVAGRLADIDTSAFSVGTQLYLSSTTAGAYTSTKQYAPAHLVYVGIIVRSHPTQGIIEVKIQNGYELDELHNVAAQTPTNNDGLFWEASTSLWKNKSIATILGYTPQAQLNGTGFVKASGTSITYDNSTYLTTSAAATTYLPLVLSSTANVVDINGQQFNIWGSASGYTSGRIIVDPVFSAIGYQNAGVFDGLKILTNGNAEFSNSGITRFFNQVRFDSTLSNGTYTYTLPGATGTIALVGGAGVGTVTSVSALTIGTSGTDISSTVANSTTTPVITLNVPTASATNRGALSSTDWTTFNNKQNALTNPVTGTGTTNYLPKFTGTSTIGNSIINEGSGVINIGTTASTTYGTLNVIQNSIASPNWVRGIQIVHPNGTGVTGGYISISNIGQKLGGIQVGDDAAVGNLVINPVGGNLGLGVTPSAWSVLRGLQNGMANLVGYVSNSEGAWLTNNAFYNGTSWVYQTSSQATMYQQLSGVQSWHIAASGTAGNAISFTQAMTLDASGRLGLGISSPDSRLHVLDAAGNGLRIGFLSGTNNFNLYDAAIHAFRNNGGTTEYMRLTSAGELCVGRTSAYGAGFLVNVQGNIYASAAIVAGSTIDAGGRILAGSSSNTSNAFSGQNNSTAQATIYSYNHNASGWSIYSAQGINYFAGNVGIGTASPSGTLELLRANDSGVILRIGNTGSTYFDFSRSSSTGALSIQGNQTGNNNILLAPTSGSVGIGTTSPSQNLHVASSGVSRMLIENTANQSTGAGIQMLVTSGGSVVGNGTIRTDNADNMQFFNAGGERMRITSGGALLLNGTTQGDGVLQVFFNDAASSPFNYGARIVAGRTNSSVSIAFSNPNGVVGSIQTSGTSTSYNTSSDYRLKQDLKDFNGLDLLNKIKTYDYEWKADKTRSYGVIAHELQSVINYAVTGVKDGKEMQGVDYSKIVPVLIKSIQELKQELDTLKNK